MIDKKVGERSWRYREMLRGREKVRYEDIRDEVIANTDENNLEDRWVRGHVETQMFVKKIEYLM